MNQTAFPFLQEIDDKKAGIARIDGWPVLNTGYQSGWINRRLYPYAEEALDDAIKASNLVDIRLYVVAQEVTKGFEKHWPEKTNWRITRAKPYKSFVAGAYYQPTPEHYVVLHGLDIHEPGLDPEFIARKKRQVMEQWEKRNRS